MSPKPAFDSRRSKFTSALCALALAGCAGPQVSQAPDAKVTADKGVVVLSVSHDADTGAGSMSLFYVDEGRGTERRVLQTVERVMSIPTRGDLPDTRGILYALELSPGTHEIVSWQTATNGVRVFPRGQLPPLTFEAKAGEVTYIGNLHMVNVMGRPSWMLPSMPIAGTPEVRDRAAIDVPLAEKKFPALAGRIRVALMPVGPWTASTKGTNLRMDPLPPPPPPPPPRLKQ